jgi:hypothetical protein
MEETLNLLLAKNSTYTVNENSNNSKVTFGMAKCGGSTLISWLGGSTHFTVKARQPSGTAVCRGSVKLLHKSSTCPCLML